MPQLWAGIDAGKTEHHCVVIDANGTKLLTGNALLAADANQDSFVTWEDAQLLCDKYVRIDSYSSPLA